MNRLLFAVPWLLVGACASGSGLTGDAGPIPGGDADETFLDAPVDGRPDGPPADAFVPDAFVPDAFVPDAFVPDAFIPPDACVPVAQEKLVNPVLDLTPTGVGWTDVPLPNLPGGPFPVITADPPEFLSHSAPNKAWFGGASGSDASPAANSISDQLFQQFTLPADTTTVVVSGFFAVGTTDSTTLVRDSFTLDITDENGVPIENVLSLNNTMGQGTFTAFSKTISANLAGRIVRLRGTSTNNANLHSNFFLDSFSFRATHCPI